MTKLFETSEVIGVRISSETKQSIAKKAAILGVAQSSFVRLLVRVGLEHVDKDPAVLLRSEEVGLSGKT